MTTASMELRRAAAPRVDGRTLHGLAAPYGVESHPIGGAAGFVETIQRGAFDRSISQGQVSLWWQHGAGRDVLASQRSGTLKLESREDGLHYEATLGATAADDLYLDRVGRGLVPEMSFGFTVAPGGEEWKDGKRTLKDVDLWELSPVESGAYPNTKAARRGKDGTKEMATQNAMSALTVGIATLGLRDCMERARALEEARGGAESLEERATLKLAHDEATARIADLAGQPATAIPFNSAKPSQLRTVDRSAEMVQRWIGGGGRAPLDLDLRSAIGNLREIRATMGVAVSGGVNFGTAAVNPSLERDFIKSMLGPTAIMQLAKIQPCSGPYNKPLIGSRDTYTSGSVKAEGGTGTARDFNATSLAFAPVAHSEMYQTSTELLEDASYDVAAEIADEIAIAQGIWWDNMFVSGTGSGQPQGVTVATWTATHTTATNDVLAIDDLMAAKDKINPQYWANACWVMAPATWGSLRRTKVTSLNTYVIDGQRDNMVVDGIQRPMFDGHPVYLCSAMPAVADAAYPVVFGDFRRGYEIAMRRQLTIKRGAEDATALQSGLVDFVGIMRLDGRMRDPGACIKILVA